MPERSRRVRYWLFAMAGLALIVAALAFYVSLSQTSSRTDAALRQARQATVRSETAADRADMAAAKASAALMATAAAKQDICTFLHDLAVSHHAVREDPAEAAERRDAIRLFASYGCVSKVRG